MATYKVTTDRLDGYQVGDTITDKDADPKMIHKLLVSGAIIKHTPTKKSEPEE